VRRRPRRAGDPKWASRSRSTFRRSRTAGSSRRTNVVRIVGNADMAADTVGLVGSSGHRGAYLAQTSPCCRALSMPLRVRHSPFDMPPRRPWSSLVLMGALAAGSTPIKNTPLAASSGRCSSMYSVARCAHRRLSASLPRRVKDFFFVLYWYPKPRLGPGKPHRATVRAQGQVPLHPPQASPPPGDAHTPVTSPTRPDTHKMLRLASN
jgi:hypothetical protein